jgi:predicted TIM-barrel fold metal-dependent hydrolase
MSTNLTQRRIIDFHAHWLPGELVGWSAPSSSGELIQQLWPLLTDSGVAIESAVSNGIDLRVLSTALETLALVSGEPVSPSVVRSSNELLAEEVKKHSPHAAGLASVDAFSGEAGAEEARYAIDELGLRGLFIAAVSGELLLNAPEARPTLEFAAERELVVFAHPVNPPVLAPRFAGVAGAGHALSRATESAISTLALLGSGVLSELPKLRVVIAQLGSAALLLAHYVLASGYHDASDGWAPIDDRARLYVDTAGFEPIAIRAALEAVGVEHILVGTDWPIDRAASAATVEAALGAGGVQEAGLDQVSSLTALELLGLSDRAGAVGGAGGSG